MARKGTRKKEREGEGGKEKVYVLGKKFLLIQEKRTEKSNECLR